ncbi:hypothetical protein J1605_014953 [Eschrichtius robustus]|uniref:Galactosylgalactosylxylosylprotein 3-beta-glucuronosyltransferase n=1 Tax=Eschrichtius robustus TaxID=9764 RepID=A0AB34GDR6_ESCRO|nr:hypothetical protein J1605_014953 [Eschrichtius robustus]
MPGCQRSPHICTSKGGWPGADSQGRACDPDPGSVAGEPAAPENPVAAGEAVHTNPDSWCSRALGHRKPGSSGSRTCDPIPPPWRHLQLWPPNLQQEQQQPNNPSCGRGTHSPSSPHHPLSSPHGCRAPDPSNPGRSAGTHHPRAPSCGASDSSDTGNSKAPATPETQAATTRAPGFAVSLQVILSNPKAVFKRRGSQPGMQESDFLKQITTVEELEPKASNCTKSVATRQVSSPQVLVWHTRTEKVNLANEPKYHLDAVTIEV